MEWRRHTDEATNRTYTYPEGCSDPHELWLVCNNGDREYYHNIHRSITTWELPNTVVQDGGEPELKGIAAVPKTPSPPRSATETPTREPVAANDDDDDENEDEKRRISLKDRLAAAKLQRELAAKKRQERRQQTPTPATPTPPPVSEVQPVKDTSEEEVHVVKDSPEPVPAPVSEAPAVLESPSPSPPPMRKTSVSPTSSTPIKSPSPTTSERAEEMTASVMKSLKAQSPSLSKMLSDRLNNLQQNVSTKTCPDCGLSLSTKFCSETGRLHAATPEPEKINQDSLPTRSSVRGVVDAELEDIISGRSGGGAATPPKILKSELGSKICLPAPSPAPQTKTVRSIYVSHKGSTKLFNVVSGVPESDMYRVVRAKFGISGDKIITLSAPIGFSQLQGGETIECSVVEDSSSYFIECIKPELLRRFSHSDVEWQNCIDTLSGIEGTAAVHHLFALIRYPGAAEPFMHQKCSGALDVLTVFESDCIRILKANTSSQHPVSADRSSRKKYMESIGIGELAAEEFLRFADAVTEPSELHQVTQMFPSFQPVSPIEEMVQSSFVSTQGNTSLLIEAMQSGRVPFASPTPVGVRQKSSHLSAPPSDAMKSLQAGVVRFPNSSPHRSPQLGTPSQQISPQPRKTPTQVRKEDAEQIRKEVVALAKQRRNANNSPSGSISKKKVATKPPTVATQKGLIKYNDGSTYKGGILDSKRHGKGRLTQSDHIYDGEWDDNQKHGEANSAYPGKGIHSGMWSNNEMTGNGKLTIGDLEAEGDFVNGKLHGVASIKYPNGDSYMGEVHNNKRGNSGSVQYANDDRYQWKWKDPSDVGTGIAILSYRTGDVYEGEICKYKKHGNGTFTFSDGHIYSGQFHDGMMEGKGCFKYSTGGEYTGSMRANSFHGTGTYDDGQGQVYTGEWHNGKMHGKGLMIFENGDKWEGIWEDDARVEGRYIHSGHMVIR
eukprot:TRINITY_DN11788_c0_g1_i1.p1 TRINITY_DN11788_c0_g1~~TRINITY_DN11788_c0_g1_i1.p1  ORF type:complete len:948 (+),score=212.36 TRINITY_DN11788_c0_g1_i1:38-2881(+)